MKAWQTWISYFVLNIVLVYSAPSGSTDEIFLVTQPVPVTFTTPSSMLRFQPWNFQKYKKLDIRFSSRERRGILFFVGNSGASQDCIGVDIFNLNLYFYGILNGKEFRIQLNPTGTSVSNGRFYNVAMEMLHTGHLKMIFEGVANPQTIQAPPILEFDSYTYIGGVDSISRLPWISYAHDGFAGCIEYLRVNDDKFIDTNKFAKQTEMLGVKTGVALTSVAQCIPGICGPGKCQERSYNLRDASKNFFCDCSGTFKTYSATATDILRGESCIRDSTPFECDKKTFVFFDFEIERMTHTDDISLDFKTTGDGEPLFFAKRKHGEEVSTFISADVVYGQVVVAIKLHEGKDEKYKKIFVVPIGGLNDGKWHTLKITRYVQEVTVFVDSETNIVKGELFRSPGEKFYNKIREIYLGSNTAKTGTDKCSGAFKNLYWNENDLLNTRNYLGRYQSQIISNKPRLPELPPFPRQPPNPCSIKPNHQRTLIPNVSLNPTSAIFMIELRTKYDGVIFYAEIPNKLDDLLTVMISGNSLIVPYQIGLAKGVIEISLTRGGINIRDNSWHRIVVELSKLKSSLTVFVDDIQELTKEVVFEKPLQNIDELTFSIAGFSEVIQYYKVLAKLQEFSPSIVTTFSGGNDHKFVGCLGEFLTNKETFSKNLLNQISVIHVPSDSVFCRACQEVAKCPRNFCQNNGQCYNVNENSIACNCSGTGFYGSTCDIKNPTCLPTDCLNGGMCKVLGAAKSCNCTGTGYTGANCDVSLCTNFVCQNNGICRLINGEPMCDCSGTTFIGPYCQQAQCPKDFCKNNGQCKLDNETRLPLCDCKGTGFIGVRCDKEICPPTQCNRNGNCVVREDKPFCYCFDDFLGQNCDQPVCTPDRCLNGGKCTSLLKKPVCSCTRDYEGERCDIPKPCPQGSCLYGGSCTMTDGKAICNCKNTDYFGPQCESPKSCPSNFCQNRGTCSVKQSNFVCDCSKTGYAGSQCTEKLGCPNGFCAHGGFCSNTDGKFMCDCSQTGYGGDKCDQQTNGMMCPYYLPGYPVKMFKPPKLTSGMLTTMGFQTWVGTGTIFCYQTLDDKYWSAKLMDGKVVLDINGRLFNMRTKVNDGKYHVLSVNRDAKMFLVTLDFPVIEMVTIPIEITNIISLPANLIAYTKLIICNSCPDTEPEFQFQGAVGGAKSGSDSIIDQLNSSSVAMIGRVSNTLVPIGSLQKPRASDFCHIGYCKNGGKCFLQNLRPNCDCGVSGYDGSLCDKKMFLIKSVPPDPGYVVHNFDPAVARNFDLWKFMAAFINSTSPLATFILSDGNYIEFRLENGKISLSGSGVPYGFLNQYPLELNFPHFFKIKNMLGRFTMYVNKTKTGAVTLPDNFLMANGSIKVIRIIVGANKNLDDTIKGYIGGYQFNSNRLLFPNGTLLPTSTQIRTIIVEPWIVFKKRILQPPDRNLGSHGGMVYINGKSFFANGFGAGGIVPTGAGAVILGQVIALAGGVLPISSIGLGFIVAALLFISAIIWSVFYLGLCGLAKTNASIGAIGAGKSMHQQYVPLLDAPMPSVQMNGSMVTGGMGIIDFAATTPRTLRLDLSKGQSTFRSAGNTMVGANNWGGGYGTAEGYAMTGGYVRDGGNGAGGGYSLGASNGAAGGGGGGGYSLGAGNGMGGGYTMGGGGSGGESSRVYLTQNYLTVPNEMSAQMKMDRNMAKDVVNERAQQLNSGNTYSSANYGQEATVMNVFSGEEIKVESCLLSADSKFAVTGSVSGPPQIWDMSSGELIQIMNGDDLTYTCLNLAHRSDILVGLVVENQQLPILKRFTAWNFRSREEIEMREKYICTTLCISPDTESCIMADETRESAITVLNLKNEQSRKLFYNQPDTLLNERIQLLKITNNSQYIVAGCRSVENTSLYLIFDQFKNLTEEPKIININSTLQSCDFINDLEMVIGTELGEIIIWNLKNARAERKIVISALLENGAKDDLKPHENKINCIEVSKDRSIMVTGGSDSRLLVWEMQGETLRQRITKHDDEIQSVALTKDNEILVSGSWDGSIRMWNLNNGQEMCTFVSNIEITKVLISNDKVVIVALGEKSGVNKFVMLKLVRNVSKIVTNARGEEMVNGGNMPIVSPPL